MRSSSLIAHSTNTFDCQNDKRQSLELSLVIPTYNEQANIKGLILNICHVLDLFLEAQYEIIVVDDSSQDGDNTREVVKRLIEKYPQVRLMSRNSKSGLATAAVDGWQISQGKILGLIDGDFQHPPKILPKLLQAIYEGADLAIASRNLNNSKIYPRGLIRYCLSHTGRLIAYVIFPKLLSHVSDPMSGYFLVRYDVVSNIIFSHVSSYKILLEIIVKSNTNKIKEISYTFQERKHGKSKLTLKQCFKYLLHLSILRCNILTFLLCKSKLL